VLTQLYCRSLLRHGCGRRLCERCVHGSVCWLSGLRVRRLKREQASASRLSDLHRLR
jgi:hypothetical protein